MDVHPPHHPIETKRDFFLHLFTITCGLLIALGLEGLVEWGHHRELVDQARSIIQAEIRENQKASAEDLRYIHENAVRFKSNIETERTLRNHPGDFRGHLSFTFTWSSMNESAWRTAQETGAFGYMPYAEVQRYADLYNQQSIVNGEAVRIFRLQTEASGPIYVETEPTKLSKDELARLLDNSAVIYSDLQTLGQLLRQLRDQYTETLKAR